MALTNEANPMLVKAWVQFTSVTTTAITNSFNIASLTDLGVGATTVNLSVTMSDTDFPWAGSGNDTCIISEQATARTTTSISVVTRSDAGTAADYTDITVIVFGDVA